jgi:hypothetical protein
MLRNEVLGSTVGCKGGWRSKGTVLQSNLSASLVLVLHELLGVVALLQIDKPLARTSD